MDKKTLGYGIATGLFCAVLGYSGFARLTHLEPPALPLAIGALSRLLRSSERRSAASVSLRGDPG